MTRTNAACGHDHHQGPRAQAAQQPSSGDAMQAALPGGSPALLGRGVAAAEGRCGSRGDAAAEGGCGGVRADNAAEGTARPAAAGPAVGNSRLAEEAA